MAFAQGTHALARRPSGTSSVTNQLKDSLKPVADVLSRHARGRVTNRIWKLGTRQANWDGHGSLAPNLSSIPRAAVLVEVLIEVLAHQNLEWTDPHVGLDENGDVVLEWWNGDRKLTIYVLPDSNEYIRSWGPNIEDQMEQGPVGEAAFVNLWNWLRRSSAE
jgi:hypothetical protein